MSDLKIQGVVEMSSEGAENALNRIGDKASQMASQVENSADKAGKAVDGIGTGADKSADNFTRAEGRIVQSIKRATTNLELLGKTASQKLEFKINTQGLETAKFEPLLAKLREVEQAQQRLAQVGASVTGFSPSLQNNIKNTSYQLQDFIVQVNGGVDASKALGQQLPQMLVGFGAAGAAIGVLAALVPNLVAAFSDSGKEAKKFSDALSDFDKAIGEVGSTVKSFDMDKLYEQFNNSSDAVRAATVEQLNFQREYIKTTQLVAGKKFGESISGIADYGTLNKAAGAYGASGTERLAKELGITLEVAKDLYPVMQGLKTGSEDVNLAFNKFGTALLKGNSNAIDLAKTMGELAKTERDAAAAQSAISEAQEKMSNGHVTTKKEAEEAERASKKAATEAEKRANAAKKEAEALEALINSINGRTAQFDSDYVSKVEKLIAAYGKGSLSLSEYNDALRKYYALQPGVQALEKERLKALQDAEKAQADYMRGIGSETEKLLEKAKASEEELSRIGLTAEQLASLTANRYDEQIAIKQAEAERLRGIKGREAEVFLIEQQIDALGRLKNSEVAKPKLQAQAQEWKKFASDLESSLTGALMRSFESGDSFGKSFVKNLQNLLKTTVLKVAIQGTVNAGLQAVGLTGSSGGASLLGTAANGVSLYSNATGGGLLGSLAGSASSYGLATGVSGASAQASMLAAQTAEFGTYGLAATAEAGGMAASGMLTTAASAMPYVAAAMAIYSIASSMGKSGGPKASGLGLGTLGASGLDVVGRSSFDALYGAQDFGSAAESDMVKKLVDW